MTTQDNNKPRDYNFEYTDTKTLLKLFGLSFGIFILLLLSISFTRHYIGIGISIILAFIIPALIFWLNRKKTKKQGSASINESSVDFKTHTGTTTINYKDIKSYIIQHYNGIYFKIIFVDKRKFVIGVNENFCNPETFEIFCDDFEAVLYNKVRTEQLHVTRIKTFMEKKWFFVFLVITSILFCAGIIRILITGIPSYSSLFISIGILASLWTGYLTARSKSKDRL